MPTFIHTDRGSGFMSSELKNFLLQKGIATSRTTSYNPAGNGQIERLNGTLWKTIILTLKTKDLPTSYWQEVLLDALHSIRSLLCTATNATPHERMFSYQRKSTSGVSIPSWLTTPGPVLLNCDYAASALQNISMHFLRVNFLSCSNRLLVCWLCIPRTILSLNKLSLRQSEKLHVFARFRRAVT